MASSVALATNAVASAKVNDKLEQTPTKTVATVAATGAAATASASSSAANANIGSTSSGTCVQWGPVEVSKAMQDGEKFVKWDEVRLVTVTRYIV